MDNIIFGGALLIGLGGLIYGFICLHNTPEAKEKRRLARYHRRRS